MSLFGLFGSKSTSARVSPEVPADSRLQKPMASAEAQVKEEKVIPWNKLTSLDQLDEIVKESKSIPVAIFKHSTRCGISRMVMNQFEKSYTIDTSQMKLYYLDLLAFRDVSNEVGYKFQVLHQSPQLIVVKNGVAVANTSHHSIQASDLEKFV